MRKLVLAMMTSLDGRLDKLEDWLANPSDEIDTEFERVYERFDTVLVGHTFYYDMAGYWPKAEADENMSDANKRLARKLNSYKKYVFSRKDDKTPLAWNNTELVNVPTDNDLIAFINDLKAQQGKDIHVVGGAHLAQSLSGLGLVDEYQLYTFPVVSKGVTWFEKIDTKKDLEFLKAIPFQNGAIGLHYASKTNP
ncbi:MAG: dihydrofolate reductase family protein [Chloroflexota bacterium]